MGTGHHPVCDVAPRGRAMGFEDCPGAHVLSHDFWEFRMSWHLKTLVGWADRVREPLLASLVGPARLLAAARVPAGVVWAHCTRAGIYWMRVGGTAGRWGLRAVRTTRGQWIPTLVE